MTEEELECYFCGTELTPTDKAYKCKRCGAWMCSQCISREDVCPDCEVDLEEELKKE